MISNSKTFSVDVKLYLYADGQQYDVGSLGPGFGFLRTSQTIAASEGEIETIVDQKISRWPVRITSPITGESKRFTFEAV